MAINPLLSLQVESLDTATPVQNVANMRLQGEQMAQKKAQGERQERMVSLREEQLDLEKLKTEFAQKEAGEKRRLRNVALGSAQLKNVLNEGGEQAARQWLENNREGNNLVGLPSEDTEEAMALLEQGDIDQLNTALDNNVFVGESLGLIETGSQGERWAPIYDDEGNVIAQRNLSTGKVASDPRAGSEGAQFEPILGPDGKPVAQKDTQTGRVFAHPQAEEGGDAGGGLKASDENAIYRFASGLYGGVYDPRTGEISGLNPDEARNVAAISSRASRMVSDNPSMTRSEAVRKAAGEMDIDIPELGNEDQGTVIRYDAQGNRIE